MPIVAPPARTTWGSWCDNRVLAVRDAMPRRGELCLLCGAAARRAVESKISAGADWRSATVRRTALCFRCAPRHGLTGYVNDGCRCAGCREAWSAYQTGWKRRNREKALGYQRSWDARNPGRNTERQRALRRRRAGATA